MNGYLTMDGNVPFYMSTHKDGSASIWPLGPEWVLDMPMDDAWFYADGSETTFGPKDIPYAGMWEDASDYGLISPDELWSDRYTYNIPLEKPSGQRMTSYYNSLNISMSSVSGYDQSRGVSVRYMDWGAWQPTPLSPFEAPEQQLLLAPGRTTLKVNIEYAKVLPIPGNPQPIPLVDTPYDISVVLNNIYCDGYYLDDSTQKISDIIGGKYQMAAISVYEGRGSPYGFTAEFDLSKYMINYRAFLEHLTFEVSMKIKVYGTYKPINLNVQDIIIEKTFEVYTASGISEDYEMVLPVLDTGTITDIRFSRKLLPHRYQQVIERLERRFGRARVYSEEPLWKDTVKMVINDYNDVEVLQATLQTANHLQPSGKLSISFFPQTEQLMTYI